MTWLICILFSSRRQQLLFTLKVQSSFEILLSFALFELHTVMIADDQFNELRLSGCGKSNILVLRWHEQSLNSNVSVQLQVYLIVICIDIVWA